MAREKFTVQDIEQELQRRTREAKASLPTPGRKKESPNSDHYGEHGRRIYSANDAATMVR